MANPRLLLLDEVSLGLAPVAVDAVYASLTRLITSGTTVVLVEQDLRRAMSVADRVMCMLEGRIVLEGACGRADARADHRRVLRARARQGRPGVSGGAA